VEKLAAFVQGAGGVLGEGWSAKRRLRTSGIRAGAYDTYYISPDGEVRNHDETGCSPGTVSAGFRVCAGAHDTYYISHDGEVCSQMKSHSGRFHSVTTQQAFAQQGLPPLRVHGCSVCGWRVALQCGDSWNVGREHGSAQALRQ
jgi:hypothetical protein